jgi:hypothetical protein
MAENDDFLDRRFEQQANLMVDLRVAQIMTDKQISELSKSIAEFRANANEVFGPILLNHEERMKKIRRVDGKTETANGHAARAHGQA